MRLMICVVLIICWPLDVLSQFSNKLVSRNIIKFSAVELARVNLRTIKIGHECYFKNGKNGFETELGFTHYSKEDSVSTKGFYTGLYLNRVIGFKRNERYVLKAMFFYQRLYMNSYLLYLDSSPGIGNYYKFNKTKYIKARSGVNFIFSYQKALYKRLIFEINTGFGIIHFKSFKIDSNVVQENYINGLYNRERNFWAPNVILNLKIGYIL